MALTFHFTSCSSTRPPTTQPVPVSTHSPVLQQPQQTEFINIADFEWIVIGDPRFKEIKSEEVTFLPTNQTTPEILQFVLTLLNQSNSVISRLYTSKEIRFLTEKDAHGVTAYKAARDKVSTDRELRGVDEDIMKILINESDSNSTNNQQSTERILMIDTETKLPYSSIFIELEHLNLPALAETALPSPAKR